MARLWPLSKCRGLWNKSSELFNSKCQKKRRIVLGLIGLGHYGNKGKKRGPKAKTLSVALTNNSIIGHENRRDILIPKIFPANQFSLGSFINKVDSRGEENFNLLCPFGPMPELLWAFVIITFLTNFTPLLTTWNHLHCTKATKNYDNYAKVIKN